MSASTFRITKQCVNCGSIFEAQKTTTKYCSHKCNQRHYKLRKKLEKKGVVEKELVNHFKPTSNALSIAHIKEKDYLTVKEVSTLIGCSTKTVYRMIDNKVLKAINLNEKLTRIKREDIEQLFE